MIVVSTGFAAPSADTCRASVRSQRVAFPVEHRYVEASTQRPARNVITNVLEAVGSVSPSEIVVWLDGDDWLAAPDVLQYVADTHEHGAWVTWGSFEFADGRPGFAADLDWSRPVRQQPWVTTHLKTFRAGLLHRMRDEDLHWPDGTAAPWDMLVMFAAIEMAGPDRCRFCPTVLSIYNFANSYEFRHGPSEERRIEGLIRSRAPYTRVAQL